MQVRKYECDEGDEHMNGREDKQVGEQGVSGREH